MLSAKINNVARLLRLMADPSTRSLPQRRVIDNAAQQLEACVERAKQLEAVAVPKSQRLDASHLASGKVALFPVVAAPEATQ